jgi:hypothetical protein
MKTTRALLLLAAALSLGLAVFASVRTHGTAIASSQSATLKVADDNVPMYPPGDDDDDGGTSSAHLV